MKDFRVTYADLVAAASRAIDAQSAIRHQKVRGIRERIRRGTFAPTPAAIARRLLGR